MATKHISVITGGESTRERLVRQLEGLFEDSDVIIEGFAVNLGFSEKVSADLIVFSSASLINEAESWLNPGAKQIVARRAVDSTYLDQLFSIKNGANVLLVNDSEEAALESIELLKRLGINGVELLPWYPEMDSEQKMINRRKCHVAVTLGEADLVPEGMLHVIDLGPRVIDLSTIVEILQSLGLLNEKSHYLSATYLAAIVRMGQSIHKAMSEQERINGRLEQVLNQIHDGLLAYDQKGIVRVFSQRCETIFGVRAERVIGKQLMKSIRNKSLMDFLGKPLNDGETQTGQLHIEGKSYEAERFSSGKGEWMVCAFRETVISHEKGLQRRRLNLMKGHMAKYSFDDIYFKSEIMAHTVAVARKLALTNLPILIYGESGTGKELFASAVHRASSVAEGPFIGVNFSALPESLVESELFGYDEGAFTGAKKGGHPGLFEQANGGTLFLDEIGDISVKMQMRLLRVLQEKEIMRVGGSEIIPVDVRIIAATNKDLLKLCEAGRFREDLYYRLKKLSLNIPPLRHRHEDVPGLLEFYLKKNGWNDTLEISVAPDLMSELLAYDWRGNVRELENVVEYMTAVSEGASLTLSDLPSDFINFECETNKNRHNNAEKPNKHQKAPVFDEVTADLASPLINRRDLIAIMTCIDNYNQKGESLGRGKLSEILMEQGFHLSQDMVRRRLKTLDDEGCIVSGKGRMGAILTEKGRRMLKFSKLV